MTNVLKTTTATLALACVALFTNVAAAQEACFAQAQEEIRDYATSDNTKLAELSRQYEADPNQRVNYKGISLPVEAALLAEATDHPDRVGEFAKAKVSEAEECARRPEIANARVAWDVFRNMMGLTQLLPEAATRIDFAEITDGDIFGGRSSFVNKGLEDIEKLIPKLPRPKIELPKIPRPKVNVPKVNVPKVKVPKVKVPKFKVPKIKIKGPKF